MRAPSCLVRLKDIHGRDRTTSSVRVFPEGVTLGGRYGWRKAAREPVSFARTAITRCNPVTRENRGALELPLRDRTKTCPDSVQIMSEPSPERAASYGYHLSLREIRECPKGILHARRSTAFGESKRVGVVWEGGVRLGQAESGC